MWVQVFGKKNKTDNSFYQYNTFKRRLIQPEFYVVMWSLKLLNPLTKIYTYTHRYNAIVLLIVWFKSPLDEVKPSYI